MKCLEGYIGIKGCPADQEPESGLYVNELPGINLKSVVEIADTDQQTYLEVWDDVEKRALRRFSTMLTAYFKQHYKLKLLFDRVRIGTTVDSSDVIPAANERRGIKIELNPNSVYPRVSPLVTVCISNFEFYSTAAITGVNFYINNGTEELWTESFDLTEGWNKIQASYCIPAASILNEITVSVDATALPTVNAQIGVEYSSGQSCCECCISSCCSAEIKGFILTPGGVETTQNNNTHGFRGYVAMECKYDGLVCGSKDIFASALWYLLGEEMMIERVYSDTINKYTTVGKSDAKELRDYYKEKVAEELTHIVDGIDLKRNDCCLECNDQIQDVPTIG